MANIGTIQTSITLPIELFAEMERIRDKDDLDRSRFIQTAVRLHLRRVKTRDLKEFIDELHESELNILKELIKKGAV